jgi:hypothetical protein
MQEARALSDVPASTQELIDRMVVGEVGGKVVGKTATRTRPGQRVDPGYARALRANP